MLYRLTSGEYEDFAILGDYEIPSVQWLREKLEEYRQAMQEVDTHYFGREGFDGVRFMIWLCSHYPQEIIDKTPPAPPALWFDWNHPHKQMKLLER